MKAYIYNVLRGFDVFVNTLLAGQVRTISARIGDKKASGDMDVLTACIDWALEKIDPGHSIESYEAWRVMTERDGTMYELTVIDQPKG